jgi:hypothetical protein
VTEATLRLAPLLPTKCAVVGFEGVEEAVAAATEMWVLPSSYSLLLASGFLFMILALSGYGFGITEYVSGITGLRRLGGQI